MSTIADRCGHYGCSSMCLDDDLFPIEGYEGIYSITRNGRVWSKPRNGTSGGWKIPSLDKDGYMIASLCKNGYLTNHKLHRLVARTFISNPLNKPQINHISGIKTNNHISNLSWVTPKENDTHARETGLMDNVDNSGAKNGRAKLTQKQVDEIRRFHSNRKRSEKTWEKYNISSVQYYKIIRKDAWEKEE